MTARDELDRVLGEWLADGPTRAPDWPIDRAIAHARTHPRRPDPLGLLRAPAFPARVGGFNPRPALLFAAALLLALALTALVVGSRTSQLPIVVPPPSAPISTPEATPTPAPHESGPVHVALKVAAGQPATIDINYEGNKLVDARSGQPGDGVSVSTDEIAVTNDGPNTIVLTWSGAPCESSYRLDVTETAGVVVLWRPRCTDTDAIAFDRVLVLTFSEPISARSVAAKILLQDEAPSSQP
jgi:hypothetical protein